MIEGILFIVIYLLLPIIWIKMINIAGIRLFRISIPGILMFSIFLFQYVGFPILFYELNDYRAQTINDQNIIWQVFAWSSFTITLLITGFIFARKTFGPIHKNQSFNSFGLSPQHSVFQEYIITILLFISGFIVLILYIRKIEFSNLAISVAIGLIDSNLSSEVLRSSMGNNFDGKYHWYRFFMRDITQIATLTLFGGYLLTPRLNRLLILIIAFLVTAFSMLISTEKGPIMWFLISMLMVYLIIKKAGYIPFKWFIIGSPLLLLIIGIFYIHLMNSPSIYSGIQSALSRITTGQIAGLYHYIIIFPEKIEYLLGRTFPNPGGIFPWKPFPITVAVMDIVHPENIEFGIVGSMPTFFWGEMYANFGYLGIIFPPFFLGIFLYWFNLQLFRLSMSPITIAVFIWFVQHFKFISETGLSEYIINVTGSMILLIFIGILFLNGHGAIKFRRERNSSSFITRTSSNSQ